MSQPAANRPYVPECAQVARSFLDELRGAHRSLLAEIANMEELARSPDFDQLRCVTGRWKISQASLSRRTLSARIHDYLLTRGSAEDMPELGELQKADQALLRASAAHVGTWSTEAIRSNWRGYCEASRAIRALLQTHIGIEQRALYPMLDRMGNQR